MSCSVVCQPGEHGGTALHFAEVLGHTAVASELRRAAEASRPFLTLRKLMQRDADAITPSTVRCCVLVAVVVAAVDAVSALCCGVAAWPGCRLCCIPASRVR